MLNITATYTDQYQLTMAQVYFLSGQKNNTAVFDYFFRKLPFGSGYAIFAGLEDVLNTIVNLQFDESDLLFLKQKGFHSDFLNYLRDFTFQGTIYAAQEGDLVFPNRPVLTVEANIIEAQIIETVILNFLNFQTLIATKASRCRQAAGDRQLIDFGLRRSQSLGGYHASRAAAIGGFNATSNVLAGKDYNIPVSGTMSHSFIQSYDKEIDAFRDFAKTWPKNCVLLVDTYDTLESGVPNAIKVAQEMETWGDQLKGIRLDSGDLEHLAQKSRQLLNDAGLHYVKIAASNQLDEYAIATLVENKTSIDWFGVGTSLVIGWPDAALDGVYKLAYSNGKPRIKISENKNKTTIPCKKQVFRVVNDADQFIGLDVIALAENDEHLTTAYDVFNSHECWDLTSYKIEPLLLEMIKNGKRVTACKSVEEIATYSKHRLNQLPDSFKTLKNPKSYNIGLSAQLTKTRNKLLNAHTSQKRC